MKHWFDQLHAQADRQPLLAAGIGFAAAAVLCVAAWRMVRAARRSIKGRASSVLINIAALMATAVQSAGMWKFFANTMALPLAFRVFLFSFMEVALLACGTRAKENVRKGQDAGIDGVLVVVLALGSGVLSATDASSWQEVLVRLMVSVVAALLWERDLLATKFEARQDGKKPETLRWRFGLRSLAVRWGWADAGDASLADQGANRVFDRFVKATHAVNRLPAGTKEHRRATDRQGKAQARLMSYSRLNTDLTQLMETLGSVAIDEGLTMLGVETKNVSVETRGRSQAPGGDMETPVSENDSTPAGRGDVSMETIGAIVETPGGDARIAPREPVETPAAAGGHRGVETPRGDMETSAAPQPLPAEHPVETLAAVSVPAPRVAEQPVRGAADEPEPPYSPAYRSRESERDQVLPPAHQGSATAVLEVPEHARRSVMNGQAPSPAAGAVARPGVSVETPDPWRGTSPPRQPETVETSNADRDSRWGALGVSTQTPEPGDVPAETHESVETPRGDVETSPAADVSTRPGRGDVSTQTPDVSMETSESGEWVPDPESATLARSIVESWPDGRRITQRAFLVEFRKHRSVSNRDAAALHRYAISPAEPVEDDEGDDES